jgi:hypothetical protein
VCGPPIVAVGDLLAAASFVGDFLAAACLSIVAGLFFEGRGCGLFSLLLLFGVAARCGPFSIVAG